MQKPNNKIVKIVYCFLLTLISYPAVLSAQSVLQEADSLYAKNKYVQAYSLYDSLYDAGYYSPAMLLKMGKINEGMQEPAAALFFLEKYYWQTKDEKVLTHLQDLSEAMDVEGYDYDFEFYFFFYLNQYYWVITAILLLLLILCLIIAFRSRNRSVIILVFFMITLNAFLLNYPIKQYGVLVNQFNYLMEGPSAGADVSQVLPQGSKIAFKPHNDTWVKVSKDSETFYLRADRIKKL